MNTINIYYVNLNNENFVTLNPLPKSTILFQTKSCEYFQSSDCSERPVSNQVTFLCRPLDELRDEKIITIRLYNVLRMAGLNTLFPLSLLGHRWVSGFRTMGPKSMKEIRKIFKENKISWRHVK